MKTPVLAVIAIVFISAGIAQSSVLFAAIGGVTYGLSLLSARWDGVSALSRAVIKAGMTEEFNQFLNRVQREVSRNG